MDRRPAAPVRAPLGLLALLATTALVACAAPPVRVLTFNVLQGAGDAGNVGLGEARFPGGRRAALARAILASGADVVGVQEDAADGALLEALGEGWQRAGNVYARWPVAALARRGPLTVARVTPPKGPDFVLVNVHWRPSPYGPFELRDALVGRDLAGPEALASAVAGVLARCAKPDGARGWGETLDVVGPLLAAGERVVVTGDFNEPSALDWAARPLATVVEPSPPAGDDRTPPDASSSPGPTVSAPWEGSRRLLALGLRDAYRVVRPDVRGHPGYTWTPRYPPDTPGRRPWEEQVQDRIDWILVGPGASLLGAWVVGEADGCADLPLAPDWPSDHRAVLAELRW